MIEWITLLLDSKFLMRANEYSAFCFWASLYSSIFQKKDEMKEVEDLLLLLR